MSTWRRIRRLSGDLRGVEVHQFPLGGREPLGKLRTADQHRCLSVLQHESQALGG